MLSRGLLARSRFDGRIFTGVKTTGIYCRPICPARTPKRENVMFFSTAAAAQEAGFRSCLRCRPECSPDLAIWRGTSNTVSRGLALIADGALDGDEASVEQLAERLGMGERQLRRLFQQHLGASPITVAQTRRVLFAKQLIAETDMPLAHVALARVSVACGGSTPCSRSSTAGRPANSAERRPSAAMEMMHGAGADAAVCAAL